MASPSEPIAKPEDKRAALLRQIPSVDELLNRERIREIARAAGRDWTTEVARRVLADLRAQLTSAAAPQPVSIQDIERRVAADIEREMAFSLRGVINATGVVLHTNLGRAPIAKAAAEHLAATATRYSNLEY